MRDSLLARSDEASGRQHVTPRFDPAFVAYGITLMLLAPTLLLGFLRLELADGTFEFTVADRFLAGDRLYQDIEVYTAPLSIYFNAHLLQIFPRSVATVSVATLVSCFIIGILLAAAVYRETLWNVPLTALFLCSALYMGVYHWPRSSYSWNAILLATVAIILLVRSRTWSDGRESEFPRFFLVGVLLGGAIGFKQNIGILMLAVFVCWVADREFLCQQASLKRMALHSLALLAGTVIVPAVLVIDLHRRGTWTAFIDTVWGTSARYFDIMAVSYFSNFGGPVSMRSVPNWLLEQAVLVVVLIGLAVSALVIICPWAVRAGWRRLSGNRFAAAGSDPKFAFWAILYLGSFASIFPRADYPHVALSVPFCFAALALLGVRLFGAPSGSSWGPMIRRVSLVACLLYSTVMVGILADFGVSYARGQRVVFSEFPARGMIATAETVRFVNEVRDRVREAVPQEAQLLIAHPYACFLYPFLDRPNPSRLYYFFGPTQRPADLIALTSALDAGWIQAVLIQSGNRSPLMLYAYASENMEIRSRINDFRLFVRSERKGRASLP